MKKTLVGTLTIIVVMVMGAFTMRTLARANELNNMSDYRMAYEYVMKCMDECDAGSITDVYRDFAYDRLDIYFDYENNGESRIGLTSVPKERAFRELLFK